MGESAPVPAPWNRSEVLAIGLEVFAYPGVGLAVVESMALLIAADAAKNMSIASGKKQLGETSDELRARTAGRSRPAEDVFGRFMELAGCVDDLHAAWDRFLSYGLAERIGRHNALPAQERTAPGVLEELLSVQATANVELDRKLRSICRCLQRLDF